jgi:hypothetical protein
MKKIVLLLLLVVCFFACNDRDKTPDVSGIDIKLKLERFEKDFFGIDSNDLITGLRHLRSKYPGFYSDYMNGILGVSGADTNKATQQMVQIMLRDYAPLNQVVQDKYSNTSGLEKDLKKGFQFVKYYFPNYKVPGLISYIGTLDAPGTVLTDLYIGIGFHQFAGKDFPGYQSEEVKSLYPDYISRRFEPEYITPNVMKAVVSDLFPDKSSTLPLIEQMIEKGKQWWLLDRILPTTPDSLKTGYTGAQLEWCKDNEGLIWSYIIKREDLYSLEPAVIQTYIGEGPFTQGFSQELSPGNIGQWIGWRIVRQYASRNPALKPGDIMHTDPKKILEEARYKPK